MKKLYIVLALLMTSSALIAQIRSNNAVSASIGGHSAFMDASANLFSNSTNSGKGIAFPSTDLTVFTFNPSSGSASSYPSAFHGFIVFNTATGTTPSSGSGVGGQAVAPGFYYFSNPSPGFGSPLTAGEWLPLGGGGDATAGTITALDCSPFSGSAIQNESFFVSTSVSYTGGDEGSYFGAIVNSTGVTGLTASYAGGAFATAGGSINMIIQGTPTSGGVASFALSIGGQSCTVEINVYAVVTCPTGKQWLDRNLGAQRVPTTKTDYLGYGDLYQYGRLADGHQVVDWTSSTTANLSPTTTTKVDYANVTNVGHGNYITGNLPHEWIDSTTLPVSPVQDNDLLWVSADGDINNPCPAGFSIPTQDELTAEHAHFTSQDIDGAFDSCLKIPAAGRRESNGTLFSVGTVGFISVETTSLVVLNQSAYTSNLQGAYQTSKISVFTSYSAGSVRCIKD
jgi:hypothetical protein